MSDAATRNSAAAAKNVRPAIGRFWAVLAIAIPAYVPFGWVFIVPHGQGSSVLAMLPIAPGGILAVAASWILGQPPNGAMNLALMVVGTLLIWTIGLVWSRRTPLRLWLTSATLLATSSFFSWVVYQVYRM